MCVLRELSCKALKIYNGADYCCRKTETYTTNSAKE